MSLKKKLKLVESINACLCDYFQSCDLWKGDPFTPQLECYFESSDIYKVTFLGITIVDSLTMTSTMVDTFTDLVVNNMNEVLAVFNTNMFVSIDDTDKVSFSFNEECDCCDECEDCDGCSDL